MNARLDAPAEGDDEMAMDEETRKVIHDIRNTLNKMELENTIRHAEKEKTLAVMQAEIETMIKQMDTNTKLMVTRAEFTPIKTAVYSVTGMCGSALIAIAINSIFKVTGG